MLTALIRSKTILGIALSYGLSVLMVGLPRLFVAGRTSLDQFLASHWAFTWTGKDASLVPVVCVILAGLTAAFSRIRFREVKETLGNTNLTMLAFVSICVSQREPFFSRPDIHVATLVLVGIFMLILFTYKQESALSELFHVGLGLGVASLFVGQSIMLMVSVAFSLLMLRKGNMKEWVVFLLGFGMTAVFVWLVVIWDAKPLLAFKGVIQSTWMASITVRTITWGHAVLGVLAVASSSTVLGSLTTGTVHARNISLVNLGWLLGVVLMVVVLGVDWQAGLLLAAFPLANFMAKLIESTTRWWLADLFTLLLISAPFFSNLSLF